MTSWSSGLVARLSFTRFHCRSATMTFQVSAGCVGTGGKPLGRDPGSLPCMRNTTAWPRVSTFPGLSIRTYVDFPATYWANAGVTLAVENVLERMADHPSCTRLAHLAPVSEITVK